jgi:hypothetical protein
MENMEKAPAKLKNFNVSQKRKKIYTQSSSVMAIDYRGICRAASAVKIVSFFGLMIACCVDFGLL